MIKEYQRPFNGFSTNNTSSCSGGLPHTTNLEDEALAGFNVLDLGLIEYSRALRFQRELLTKVQTAQTPETLIFCEHDDVITIGRRGSISNILKSPEELKQKKIGIFFVDRGGDVTYHGQGQLVAYPIFDLRKSIKDIHLFLRRLELTVLGLLKFYGIDGCLKQDMTGVWVNNEKIASIGIALAKWTTYHGLSINVDPNLDYFSLINPCGRKDIRMTSIARILERTVNIKETKQVLKNEFGRIFSKCELLQVNSSP